MEHTVLVLTGGFLTAGETSLARAVRKQVLQWRHSRAAWLDLQVKLVAAEPVLAVRRQARRNRDPHVRRFFSQAPAAPTPELTEALLATLLHREGMPYRLATFDDILAQDPAALKALEECTCVFLSATMLRDMGELEPILELVRRPHNRIVVGGALAGALPKDWPGHPDIAVLAIGYGESLVPALVSWIRSDFAQWTVPDGGRQRVAGPTQVLHGALPEGTSLDDLPVADWGLSEHDRGRDYDLVHYESVRGCPYRCSFCNYPFRFDDTRFRMRSAQRMAADWKHYVDTLGVRTINCLDSLFTMPKRRLTEFCQQLIADGTRVQWVCYARADDLADEDTVKLMVEAGARLVHIGVESGDAGQLERMNKRTSPEANEQALANCRRHGLTTLASVIVGYPGETPETLESTFQLLKRSPPDFHFLAIFNTRIQAVPVLQPESMARFGLWVDRTGQTGAPYWAHTTMECSEAAQAACRLERRLMQERVSLSAAAFYGGILGFEPSQREALLDLQQRAAQGNRIMRVAFDAIHAWSRNRLVRDMRRRRLAAPIAEGAA